MATASASPVSITMPADPAAPKARRANCSLADALRATWERNPDLYYEDGYQTLVDTGGEVGVAPIGVVSWVEVDNHDDLAKAREIACHY